MSWQPPYPAGSAPPGYPTGSTLPPGYPPAGSNPVPPGYPTASAPPGYPTASAPPGHPTTASYPASYPAGYAQPQNTGYPVTGGFGNASAYPSAPGYPAYPHQGLYPDIHQNTGSAGYAYAPQDVVGYVFRPTEHEKSKHRLDVKYSASLDKYIRVSEHNQELGNWRTLVYAAQNIKHKVEPDHEMSYLAREETSVFARIEWRVDCADSGLRVKRFHIQFPTKLYEDGHVNAYIASDRGDMIPLKQSDHSQEITQLSGVQRFSIIAELSRGHGEHAWQHAQLFRQKLKPGFFSTDDSIYPFKFSVELQH